TSQGHRLLQLVRHAPREELYGSARRRWKVRRSDARDQRRLDRAGSRRWQLRWTTELPCLPLGRRQWIGAPYAARHQRESTVQRVRSEDEDGNRDLAGRLRSELRLARDLPGWVDVRGGLELRAWLDDDSE